MGTNVVSKLGIKPEYRAIVIGAPDDFIHHLYEGERELHTRLNGHFNYIHFFVKTKAALDRKFSSLKSHLSESGKLWISWPKNGQLETDLTLPAVIKIGYDHGLVESKTISIDETWSAIKFTHPKKGKKYNNSYGRLP